MPDGYTDDQIKTLLGDYTSTTYQGPTTVKKPVWENGSLTFQKETTYDKGISPTMLAGYSGYTPSNLVNVGGKTDFAASVAKSSGQGTLSELSAVPSSTVSNTTTTSTPTSSTSTSSSYSPYTMSDANSEFLSLYGDQMESDQYWQDLKDKYGDQMDLALEEYLKTNQDLQGVYDEIYAKQREDAQKGFRQGVQGLNEQAFLAGRNQMQQLSQRGLGGSGLGQLGQVQQQIAGGQSQSQLYSEFQNTLNDIATNEKLSAAEISQKEGELRYNVEQQKLAIDMQLQDKRDAYNQFKTTAVSSLYSAIKSGNYQDYQVAMTEYSRIQDEQAIAQQMEQDAAQFKVDLESQIWDAKISAATAEGDTELANELTQQKFDAIKAIGESLGYYG